MLNAIGNLFKSRKFVLGLAGALSVIANEIFGRPISETEIVAVLGVLATIIWGIAKEDAAEKLNGTWSKQVLNDQKEVL